MGIASKIARVVLITLRNDLFLYVSDTSILPISAETVVGGGGGEGGWGRVGGVEGVDHGRMNYKDTEP
jgi:hypothetical protein